VFKISSIHSFISHSIDLIQLLNYYCMHVKSLSLIVHQYLGLNNILSLTFTYFHTHTCSFVTHFITGFESQKCQYCSYARKFVITYVQHSMCSFNALSTVIQSILSIIKYFPHWYTVLLWPLLSAYAHTR